MALLNYTTTVAMEKTAAQVVAVLAKAGATQILTDYENAKPTAVAFALKTPSGVCQYRLPVDPVPVRDVLRRQQVPMRYSTPEHSERVAWRILKDWVEAQLAIIETRMVSPDQVFLPYMLINGSTVYDLYLTQQLALGPGDD